MPSATAALPRKSTFWIVGMIFISGFVVAVIAGLITAPILLSNPNLYLYTYPIGQILIILGFRYGVSYVSQKSQILPSEINKISLLVGVPYLVLFIITEFKGATTSGWLFAVLSIIIAVGAVWYFLKQRVK